MSTQHNGNMLNAITYEEHDGFLNAKKVSLVSAATIYAVTTSTTVGLTTLAPSPNFIGIVTVANTLQFTFSGNVTLDAGSKTQLIGNVTISDSKGFIGLTTTVNGQAWPDPKTYIGLATVSNATAWPDPKSYIGLATVNNATAWPDPKTYVGLMTVDIGTNNGIAVKGNVTLSDSKGFIGLVTVGGIGTVTLADSKGFIGLVTVGGIGTLTLADPKGFIGLVTVGGIGTLTLADPKGFIGLVTIGGMSTVTLADSKGFIGLATVKASILDTYASLATLTISLASIASSTTGVGRQSTLVNNATTKYTSANIYLKLETGGSAPTANTLLYVYLIRYDNNTVADDGAGTSDAALTIVNAPLLGTILVNGTGTNTFYYGCFNTAFLGSLGPQWGIAVVNSSGAALNGTESNMLKNWIGLNPQLT